MDSLGILCVTKLSRLFINPKLEVVLAIFIIAAATSFGNEVAATNLKNWLIIRP